MAYKNPTLFGVAYASRLFREVDASQAFEKLRKATDHRLDLQYPDNNRHAQALLEWLNKWGCRIPAKLPDALFKNWWNWSQHWGKQLPLGLGLCDASDCDLDILADAYDALLSIRGLGATGASKLLFAVCPETAMPWDRAIQTELKLAGDRAGYRAMLKHSKREAEILVEDAARRGIADYRTIPVKIGRAGYTLPKLLDEYHWVTITRRHQIPDCEELRQWMGWVCI